MDPGTIVYGSTWLPWQLKLSDPTTPLPHYVLIARKNAEGHVYLLPISHSGDLCVLCVEMTDDRFGSMYEPTGPWKRDGLTSHLFLREKAGTSGMWATIEGSHLVLSPTDRIGFSRQTRLADTDWAKLRDAMNGKVGDWERAHGRR